MTYLFNPEHDLCLANGSAGFVPPASALKFGLDCSGILESVFGNDRDAVGLTVWGWNRTLKRQLLKNGFPEEMLPSDSTLDEIRRLSHRRTAMQAQEYIRLHISDTGLLTGWIPEEIRSMDGVLHFMERNSRAVFKAPWSGSGKGLRWIDRSSFSKSDKGWCINTMAKQGSIMAEVRENPVCEFAMLFSVSERHTVFEGLSLFRTDNGAYKGNLLASDRFILNEIASFIPEKQIDEIQELLAEYIRKTFSGKYTGYVGADMFICNTGNGFRLCPCVEMNVRMTMGLLARKLYDNLFSGKEYAFRNLTSTGFSANGKKKMPPLEDGKYNMSVIYAKDSKSLQQQLDRAVLPLTGIGDTTNYAIAVFPEPQQTDNTVMQNTQM